MTVSAHLFFFIFYLPWVRASFTAGRLSHSSPPTILYHAHSCIFFSLLCCRFMVNDLLYIHVMLSLLGISSAFMCIYNQVFCLVSKLICLYDVVSCPQTPVLRCDKMLPSCYQKFVVYSNHSCYIRKRSSSSSKTRLATSVLQ